MKRVLFITSISGFLPQFEKNDVKILKEMGCEIHYASNFRHPVYTYEEKELEGIRLHQIDIEKSPARLWRNLKAVRQLCRIIEENDIDMIHCHNPMGGAAGRLAAFLCRRNPYVIYTAHGFHFYKGAPFVNWLLFYPAERFLSRFTDQIITINREDYDRALRFPLRSGGGAVQIHSVGVDRGRFCRQREMAASKREELGIPKEAFHIVTAAELNKNKNQKVVIRALSKIPDGHIYYSICGKGPCEGKLKKLVSRLHLEERARFLGYRTDMEEILQTADCFAFPSRREGLGVAGVEALLCGVPLVAADNRGTREYAIDRHNGIVCRYNRQEDFKRAIELLSQSPKTLAGLSLNCPGSAAAFAVEEVEKTMRKVYQKALNGRKEEDSE